MVHVPDRNIVDDAVWSEAVARETVIRRLVSLAHPSRSDFLRACRELGLRRTRLYELLRAYREDPVTSSLLPQPAGTRRGSRRLPDETEAVIAEAVRDFYETRQKPSINQLLKEIRRLCRVRGVRAPSWHAVKARVAALEPAELTGARHGPKAARDRFRPVPGQYEAECVFGVVQIDHTLADIIVVDRQYRKPLQRPWLTLAIDVASRMIAGFYLTLEAPSTISVALAIQHCVQPKEAWLAGLGISAEWPVSGFPDAIHLDNAKEFRSRTLKRGAQEYGIELIHRPAATPHYGGHIERLIGTTIGEVHLLPGTTFSNIKAKGDYDAEGQACMTLGEFERWFALQVGIYHGTIHRALGVPPIAAWADALATRPAPLRLPADQPRFLLDFLPFEMRKVRREGIELFHIFYWHGALATMIANCDRKLPVKYNPLNLSAVYVELADGDHLTVPLRDRRRSAITKFEHDLAVKSLRERGRQVVDEAALFAMVTEQRQIVLQSIAQTKSARRTAQRIALALHSGAPPIENTSSPLPASATNDETQPLVPFAIEERP